MALDGIAVYSICNELNKKLLGGRIDKIYQPNNDEIIFSIRSIGSNFKALASANPSHPRVHITELQKENPQTPPIFCMVLRKYIAGGKIVGITQPAFERIVIIEVESFNEMGDKAVKKLIIEIMGKHSNIILVDENNKILDSIKRISLDKSSVRQVLPGKEYACPPSQDKENPLALSKAPFLAIAERKKGQKLQAILYQSYTGISPIMASEICVQAGLDPSDHGEACTPEQLDALYQAFVKVMTAVTNNAFGPEIIYDPKTGKIIDFTPFPMAVYQEYEKKAFYSISELLESFYSERDNAYHIAQKAHDMRRFVVSNIERCVKKKEIQLKTIADTADMELWKRKGELITANIYAVSKGQTMLKTTDFYEEGQPEIEIALDPTKTPSENAQKYFQKYNKAKRTLEALKTQVMQNNEELEYLEGVLVAIESATDAADLAEIRRELAEQGFLKRKETKGNKGNKPKKTKPHHYISSDGYHIYVGKSSTQNDELTLHFAEPADIWMHTKNIPGSHVIIKTEGAAALPDATLLAGANLAVYYSKAKASSNVPVDYTQRRNVKKPRGAKPGMVIYEQNKTAYITVSEQLINSLEKKEEK